MQEKRREIEKTSKINLENINAIIFRRDFKVKDKKMANFLDYIEIEIVSGDGGDGVASFRREKFIPFGGPDGGDGGDGGDVIFLGTKDMRSLRDFKSKRSFKAKNGRSGSSSKKFGKNGEDMVVKVPLGTEVVNLGNQKKIADIVNDGDRINILQGGRGGLGNANFKSSTNRAPRKFTEGRRGVRERVSLNLKTISDISLVGLPNVGKSSIIQKITNSKAGIGNYAFTTLNPNLGVYQSQDNDILIADIPGLIEGAHMGKGLGHNFLKHIERSKSLIEVLDLSCKNIDELKQQHKVFLNELSMYNKKLKNRIKLIVLNKIDICSFKSNIKKFTGIKSVPIISISCVENFQINELRKAVDAI